MTFSPEQVAMLEAKLDASHVAQRTKGGTRLSYVEGWHVIAEANRIFGFDGWSRELIDLTENTAPTTNSNGNAIVSFRARVRVTVKGIVREGTGFGSGIARDIHDAYESAVKEAETDAMKRALMTFGNPFGLALYDKTQANVEREEASQPKSKADARPIYAQLQDDMHKIGNKLDLQRWMRDPDVKALRAQLPVDWDKNLREAAAEFGRGLPDTADDFPGDMPPDMKREVANHPLNGG